MATSIHPSAIVDDGAQLGDPTKIRIFARTMMMN
jgi:acyl-[acyl carrier protein]--UDP-N-acetylglucosamine O-acyltransferase